jgi:hypothetical protein
MWQLPLQSFCKKSEMSICKMRKKATFEKASVGKGYQGARLHLVRCH